MIFIYVKEVEEKVALATVIFAAKYNVYAGNVTKGKDIHSDSEALQELFKCIY